jgi:hypothetical protein
MSSGNHMSGQQPERGASRFGADNNGWGAAPSVAAVAYPAEKAYAGAEYNYNAEDNYREEAAPVRAMAAAAAGRVDEQEAKGEAPGVRRLTSRVSLSFSGASIADMGIGMCAKDGCTYTAPGDDKRAEKPRRFLVGLAITGGSSTCGVPIGVNVVDGSDNLIPLDFPLVHNCGKAITQYATILDPKSTLVPTGGGTLLERSPDAAMDAIVGAGGALTPDDIAKGVTKLPGGASVLVMKNTKLGAYILRNNTSGYGIDPAQKGEYFSMARDAYDAMAEDLNKTYAKSNNSVHAWDGVLRIVPSAALGTPLSGDVAPFCGRVQLHALYIEEK